MPATQTYTPIIPTGRSALGQAAPGDPFGAQLNSALMAKFYALAKSGQLYFAGVNGGNASAFVGAAGGTPLVGVFNPPNSGVDLDVAGFLIGVRTTGTGAVGIAFELWGGPSATPTGTVTRPTQVYSLQQSGSKALAFINTAMTGSTAIAFIGPLSSIGVVAAAAVQTVFPGLILTEGFPIVAPGNLIAVGCTNATTAAQLSVTPFWSETVV